MSEAHEKTRIRQLEDAAAHWEHKYVNARQYNRNLEDRCQKLEAELADMSADYHRWHDAYMTLKYPEGGHRTTAETFAVKGDKVDG